jgi:hypothetical protein
VLVLGACLGAVLSQAVLQTALQAYIGTILYKCIAKNVVLCKGGEGKIFPGKP